MMAVVCDATCSQQLIQVVEGQICSDPEWEAAYARFETPDQEIDKFRQRLNWFGVQRWRRDLRIAELFCGRGNGLVALSQLGFHDVEGVDLSRSLLGQYDGKVTCYVADCRALPFDDHSKDVLIVQGGLHHLPALTDDLEQCLSEARRVLEPEGRFVVVEPWLTPFLSFVHFIMRRRIARSAWPRLDALAIMVERELETYEQWLGMPAQILASFRRYFVPVRERRGLGKWYFQGRPSKSK